jgi:hypothetical protein
MAPLQKDHRQWVRWLHTQCRLPLEHVACVLELELTDVAAFVVWNDQYKGPRRAFTRGLTAPPRGGKPLNPGRIRVRDVTGKRIRAMRSLGYQPETIAVVLKIQLRDVKEFMTRTEPIRVEALKRPRTRREQKALRGSLPRFIPPPVESLPPGFDRRVAQPTPPPAPATISAEPLDQVELEPAPSPKFVGTRSHTPWVGPTRFGAGRGGRPSVTEEQAIEIRRKRAAGSTMYALAAEYKVARNTIYAVVNGKVWPENQPVPSPADVQARTIG